MVRRGFDAQMMDPNGDSVKCRENANPNPVLTKPQSLLVQFVGKLEIVANVYGLN
jgi:hypothetical protein